MVTTAAVGVLAVLVTVFVMTVVVTAHLRRQLATATAGDSREAELRAEALDRQLDSVHGELRRVGTIVADLRVERSLQHGEFLARLDDASRATADLHRTTHGLREALASPKARGQWGERTADDVLRMAGLVEGVSYLRQKATGAGTIPDVTFLLPGGLHLHMDVKFPADNYLRFLEAERPLEQEALAKAFLADVRARIRELSGRGYIDPGSTVDYVLLFIPNESIYGFIHDRDPTLVDAALAQKVVLCSPFTLFAVLAVIRQAVDAVRLEKASDEILRCLGAFGQEWDRFCEQLDKVERSYEAASRQLESLAGPRRRRLQRQVDAAHQLGDEAAPLPDTAEERWAPPARAG